MGVEAGDRLGTFLRFVAFLALASAVVVAGGALAQGGGVPALGLVLLAAGILPSLLLLPRRGKVWEAVGLGLDAGVVRSLGNGLLLGVGLAAAVVGLVAVAGGIEWIRGVESWSSGLEGLVAGIALFTLPAAGEEVLFRGYGLQILVWGWGSGPAVGLTSGLFAGLHGGNPEVTGVALVNIGLAGAFFAIVALRTGGLWVPIGAHLGWNWCLGALFGLPVSGLHLVERPLLRLDTAGAVWVSGGPFGPEGGVAAGVVLAAAVVVAWRKGEGPRPAGGGDARTDGTEEGSEGRVLPPDHDAPEEPGRDARGNGGPKPG